MDAAMNKPAENRNSLEYQLQEAQEGNIPIDVFMRHLLQSQVYMPVKAENPTEDKSKSLPLTLKSEDDTEVLILFTSPDRAQPFVDDFPGYENGWLAEFKWVLETVGIGYGITLNPGQDIGFDIEPEMVNQLQSMQ